jgi:hypothetical protein
MSTHTETTPFSQLLMQIRLAESLYAQWPHDLLKSAISLMGGELGAYAGAEAESAALEGDALLGYQYVETLKKAACTLTGDPSWLEGSDVPEEY